MRHPTGRSLSLLLLLAGLLAPATGAPVQAASPPATSPAAIRCESVADEPFGDRGRALRLRCDLAASGSLDDTLTILSRDGAAAGPLAWPAADTSDATWIFDRLSDGVPELVVDFHADGAALVADVYDAQGNPDRLRYATGGGSFRFVDPPPPTLHVVAPDGWWRRGSLVNMNLRIDVDGLLDAAFDMRRKLDGSVTTDGRVDFEIRIGDRDGDGLPDYDWRTVHPREGDQRALEQTFITVNATDNEAPLAPMLPWPYLGPVTYGYLTVSPQSTSQPPIQVNWDSGTITAVGEFVASRGNDSQWFVYSFRHAVAGRVNETDFENPFAWYDLARDGDRVPELSVRFVYYPAWDEQIVAGTFPKPIDVIRYSWDQDNDNHWDYKLALVGNYPVTSTVDVPPLSLRMVPYPDIPAWVTGRSWTSATFVASEVRDTTGEGIYVWDYPAWYIGQYVTGRLDSPTPPENRTDIDAREFGEGTIPEGYRGEYQDRLDAQPMLYASPIDHKLHLLHAAAGIWTVDASAEVRYANLAGGDVIDQWRFRQRVERGPDVVRELDVGPTHLVYFGEDGIAVRRAQVPPIAFTTLPPSSHDQWKRLSAELDALGPGKGPGDFRDIMATFRGPELAIGRAIGRDYRPTATGFRFVLELQPGFRVQGTDLLGIADRAPGSYAVTWDGAFTVEPLRPAAVRTSITVEQPRAVALTPVRVEIDNAGLEDLHAAHVELSATTPDGTTRIVASEPVDILAGESSDVSLLWGPDVPGAWRLTTRIVAADGNATGGSSLAVTVLQAPIVTSADPLALSAGPARVPVLLGILLTMAVLAALTVSSVWLGRLRP